MIKVVKFGGSSLADAVQIKKAGKIVLSEESRRYVVPSAPGKRFSDDTKVTDMLYRCYGAAVKEKKFTELLADIQKRYQEIIEGLGITLSLDEEFATIRDNFAKKIGRDYAASRGEYLNGRVIAAYLGYEFIDAAEVIKFDENGNFLSEETNQVLADRLSKVERAVIPGFYGARPDGTIQTFSRGGSDVTGSLQEPHMLICMRTGQTYPDSSLQIPVSLRIQKESKQLLTKSCVNFLIWVPAYYMKMQSSRFVKKESRSTSVIQTHRKKRVL